MVFTNLHFSFDMFTNNKNLNNLSGLQDVELHIVNHETTITPETENDLLYQFEITTFNFILIIRDETLRHRLHDRLIEHLLQPISVNVYDQTEILGSFAIFDIKGLDNDESHMPCVGYCAWPPVVNLLKSDKTYETVYNKKFLTRQFECFLKLIY